MTMIMGLNLSDRVYLSADTRVTYGNGKTVDNALKILPLLDRATHPKNNTIVVAIAGDIAFATFIYQKIYNAFNKEKSLSPDIREFYKVSQSFLQEGLNEWIESGNAFEDGDIALIFSGVTDQRSKSIDPIKLEELVKIFKRKSIKDRATNSARMEELVKTDPLMKLINEKMKKEAGMTVMENLALSAIPKIPDYIKNAINTNNPNLEEYSDSFLFGAYLNIKEKIVALETAEWGEVLAYGDRIRKETVPEELLATLELFRGREKNKPHLLEGALITATILDIAKNNQIASVGGTVIIISSAKDGEMIMGKDIIFREKNTAVRVNGIELPLIPFDKYSKYNPSKLRVKM